MVTVGVKGLTEAHNNDNNQATYTYRYLQATVRHCIAVVKCNNGTRSTAVSTVEQNFRSTADTQRDNDEIALRTN